MLKERKKVHKHQEPTYAAGLDKALEESATDKEIKDKNYTKTVQLSYDEVGPDE